MERYRNDNVLAKAKPTKGYVNLAGCWEDSDKRIC